MGAAVHEHPVDGQHPVAGAAPGDDELVDDGPLTDDELTALALAADPDAPIPADAPTVWDVLAPGAAGLLPSWYMPSTFGSRRLTGWRRRVAILLVVAFLLIDAYGLCNTYGRVVIA